jgi:hypothetical protein
VNLRWRFAAIAEQRSADNAAVELTNATPCERIDLGLADIRFNGIMLTALVTRELPAPLERDPVAAARVTERIRLRERLGIPHRDCLRSRPKHRCACLYDALDEFDRVDAALDAASKEDFEQALADRFGSVTRVEIVDRAREIHKARRPKPLPPFSAPPSTPQPVGVDPEPVPVANPAVAPPKREVLETNTRPRTRVVRRVPRWYDPPPSGGGIMDKVF